MKVIFRSLMCVASAILVVGCADQEQGPLDVPQNALVTTTFIGHAVVVDANVPPLYTNLKLSEVTLPSTGGSVETSLASVNLPNLISAQALHAKSFSIKRRVESKAAVLNLMLWVGGNVIQADVIESDAVAGCDLGKVGSSFITRLLINGNGVTVSTQPNQQVALPVGTVTINEQTISGDSITVNALHVVIPGVADVIISGATAGVVCVG